jgi:hypothetical protein
LVQIEIVARRSVARIRFGAERLVCHALRPGKLRTPPSSDARAFTQTPTNAGTEFRPVENR